MTGRRDGLRPVIEVVSSVGPWRQRDEPVARSAYAFAPDLAKLALRDIGTGRARRGLRAPRMDGGRRRGSSAQRRTTYAGRRASARANSTTKGRTRPNDHIADHRL